MKKQVRSTVKTTHKEASSGDLSSDVSMDCSCEILCDTSLSNVSDSDCSCSECLEANLDAFNEFKLVISQGSETSQVDQKRTVSLKRNGHSSNTIGNSNNRSAIRSVSNLRKTVSKNNLKGKPNLSCSKQDQLENEYYEDQDNGVTYQNLNDYILITKERTRKYLNERKNSQIADMKKKQLLKDRIKQNLEILKYTAKALREGDKEGLQQASQSQSNNKYLHGFKWNHQPYRCQCNGRSNAHKKEQCCHKKRHIKALDTNLSKFNPEFASNRSQILANVKQQRIEAQKEPQCYKVRLSKKEVKRTQKFIKQEVKKYKKMIEQKKEQERQKQKVKRAKLRAIDIKCKDLVAKSRKIDDDVSRTSFQLSIDHFSTFSELKENKRQKDSERRHKKEVRRQMKENGGKMEQAIYENDQEDELEVNSEIKVKNETHKSQAAKYEEPNSKQWCERITKDAKIHSPRKIKQGDKEVRKKKQASKKNPVKQSLALIEQQKSKKGVELQIEQRKRALMEEYKKQKQLNDNSRIRHDYEGYLQHSSNVSVSESRRR